MMRSIRLAVCVAVVSAAAGNAAQLETLSSQAFNDFQGGLAAPEVSMRAVELREKIRGLPFAQTAVPGKDDFDRFLKERSRVPAKDATLPAAGAAVAEMDLATLLNKQWRTDAVYTLGGQKAYVSGAFDRAQNAYASVYVDGWKEPKFYNIKGLLDKEGDLAVGSVQYAVSLSPNLVKPMKSQVVFENKADEEDQQRITVKKLLDAVTAAGATAKLSDQSYQVFYYNDVKETAAGPVVDPSSRTFCLILTEGEDLHVFLIPAESVPADKIAVFKMHNSKRVGLQQAGGKLKVFENP